MKPRPKTTAERVAAHRKRHGSKSIEVSGAVYDLMTRKRKRLGMTINEFLAYLLEDRE